MALARYVDRVGDGAVLALLSPDQSPHRRYLGALCARFLGAPEAAFPALLRLAAGPDPDVAPAAGRALRHIAEVLTPQEVAARESDLGAIRRAVAALRRLARLARVRPDIREHAGAAAETLALYMPPAPAAEEGETADPPFGDGLLEEPPEAADHPGGPDLGADPQAAH